MMARLNRQWPGSDMTVGEFYLVLLMLVAVGSVIAAAMVVG